MYTILVQMADEKWTMAAMHLSCALARSIDAQVALLRLVHVTHPGYLGTAFGNKPPDKSESICLEEYAATAEDYGVALNAYWIQCISSPDAIVEAADSLDATIVFARVVPARLRMWHKFQVWNLKRHLMKNHRQLFTLDEPTSFMEWTPSITVNAVAVHQLESPHLSVRDKYL